MRRMHSATYVSLHYLLHACKMSWLSALLFFLFLPTGKAVISAMNPMVIKNLAVRFSRAAAEKQYSHESVLLVRWAYISFVSLSSRLPASRKKYVNNRPPHTPWSNSVVIYHGVDYIVPGFLPVMLFHKGRVQRPCAIDNAANVVTHKILILNFRAIHKLNNPISVKIFSRQPSIGILSACPGMQHQKCREKTDNDFCHTLSFQYRSITAQIVVTDKMYLISVIQFYIGILNHLGINLAVTANFHRTIRFKNGIRSEFYSSEP